MATTVSSSSEHAQETTPVISDLVSSVTLCLLIVYSKLLMLWTIWKLEEGGGSTVQTDNSDSEYDDDNDALYKCFVSHIKKGIQVHEPFSTLVLEVHNLYT